MSIGDPLGVGVVVAVVPVDADGAEGGFVADVEVAADGTDGVHPARRRINATEGGTLASARQIGE